MSSYDDSADFEEDFREALEDLQMNNRFDIQNLTMIARENTEHALGISQVLQDHIKKVGQFPRSVRDSPTLFRSSPGAVVLPYTWRLDLEPAGCLPFR
jgi:hypothetical protein